MAGSTGERVAKAVRAAIAKHHANPHVPKLEAVLPDLVLAGHERVYAAIHSRLLNDVDGARAQLARLDCAGRRRVIGLELEIAQAELERRKIAAARAAAALELLGDVAGRALLLAVLAGL